MPSDSAIRLDCSGDLSVRETAVADGLHPTRRSAAFDRCGGECCALFLELCVTPTLPAIESVTAQDQVDSGRLL